MIEQSQKKLSKLKEQLANLDSEIDRHRLLVQIRDFKLRCLIDAVRATNEKDLKRAQVFFDEIAVELIDLKRLALKTDCDFSRQRNLIDQRIRY